MAALLKYNSGSCHKLFKKSMVPKVSIIIPIYNTESLLPRCLESVMAQTLKEIEIICVDDGSTDSSYTVLQSWAARDSRIVAIHQQNGRQGKARNTALNIAHGEFVGMIDSDDYIPSDYFERLYDAAHRHNANIAVCGIVKEKKAMDKTVVAYSTEEIAESVTDKLRLCKCPPDFFPVNKLYRRSMLEALQLRFAENVQYEDVMFVLRAICESGRMVTVPGATYRYVFNPTSTVKSRQTAAKQVQKYAAHKAMADYFESNGLPLKEKHRNLTVRHYTFHGICIWKIKEKGGRRVLRLFDAIPVYCWKNK